MKPARILVGHAARAAVVALALGAAAPSEASRLIQNFGVGRFTAGTPVPCNDPGGFAHWTTPHTPWRHNTAGQGAGKAAALQAAMAAWTNVDGASHVLSYAGTTSAGFRTDSINAISWGTGQGCAGFCLALTALVLAPGQRIVESDVTFNAAFTWTTNGADFDTQAVATHELGHTLGIHHTEVTGAPPASRPTMAGAYFGVDERTLENDDRQALQCAQTRLAAAAAILWQYSNGQLATWFMLNGDLVRATYPGLVHESWQIQGTGDFDGDGRGDILWRHETGQVAIWFMAGGVKVGEGYPGGADPGLTWRIQTVADFNTDGRADILWRHAGGQLAIWFQGDIAGAAYPGIVSEDAWQVKGAGDFDGNGSADILWRHDNGQVAIWFMAGGVKVGEGYPGGQDPGLYWSIQRVGDFDGDHRADILWRAANGQLAIWFRGDIAGAAYPGYQNVPGPVDLSWQIQGVRDFNADGRGDILWRHTGGQLAIWFMDGGLFAGEANPGLVENGWQIKGLFQDQGLE
jgi:hypothetical protein